MKPFRKYTVTVHFTDDNTKKSYSSIRVFNLFDVETYAECNNEINGFNDDLKRTIISTYIAAYIADVPFEEFDAIMTESLSDARMLDDRTDKKKDEPIPFEAQWKYKGAVKHHFRANETLIACSVHPKNYSPSGKPFEEIMSKCINSNFIYFN